jgi:hypothetical protein
MLVPTVVTRFFTRELAEALYKAHVAYFNSAPSDEKLACAWGHNVLECGRDEKQIISSCRCFNLGNITVATQDVPFWSITCSEQQRDKTGKLNGVWISTIMRFAAFDTLLDGAIYYWAFLTRRERSFTAMKTGDGYQFGLALGADHYMTANIEPYSRSLASVVKEGLTFVKDIERDQTPQDRDQVIRIMNLVAITLDESIREAPAFQHVDHVEDGDSPDA